MLPPGSKSEFSAFGRPLQDPLQDEVRNADTPGIAASGCLGIRLIHCDAEHVPGGEMPGSRIGAGIAQGKETFHNDIDIEALSAILRDLHAASKSLEIGRV